MTNAWNPDAYRLFADERARPFHDLLALIELRQINRAVDLGCGSGELSALAASSLGIESMHGIDSSAAMLAQAAQHSTDRITFEQGDIEPWTSNADHDLVLANASLQWVADHVGVLARWTAALRPGGQLAVQVPANADHRSHLTLVEVASRPEWRDVLADEIRDPVAANVLEPQEYAELLHSLGYEQHVVRLQVYGPVLDSSARVVDWMRGTSLTRVQKLLPAADFDRFVGQYRAAFVAAVGERSPYYFAFKRILMWGRRPS